MTAKKRFKRLVRKRAAKTGESYTAALRHLRASKREEPTMTPKTPLANCSFCGKHNTEVKKIVAGPGVYICDECVGLCNEVIAQVKEQPDSVRRSSEPAPDRLLEWLPSIAKTLRSVEADIARRVDGLRRQGVGWSRISEALGMSESEATRRFSTPPES
jgi:ATP-dependent Clp protease ATP-binding subunit ClpX